MVLSQHCRLMGFAVNRVEKAKTEHSNHVHDEIQPRAQGTGTVSRNDDHGPKLPLLHRFLCVILTLFLSSQFSLSPFHTHAKQRPWV